jgi:hypothetical protein
VGVLKFAITACSLGPTNCASVIFVLQEYYIDDLFNLLSAFCSFHTCTISIASCVVIALLLPLELLECIYLNTFAFTSVTLKNPYIYGADVDQDEEFFPSSPTS